MEKSYESPDRVILPNSSDYVLQVPFFDDVEMITIGGPVTIKHLMSFLYDFCYEHGYTGKKVVDLVNGDLVKRWFHWVRRRMMWLLHEVI